MTFEDDFGFPSLEGKIVRTLHNRYVWVTDIKENCFDKQKVRNAWKRYRANFKTKVKADIEFEKELGL